LSTLPSDGPQPVVEIIKERDHKLSRDRGLSAGVGVWATFLQTVGGKIGAERSKDDALEFAVEELETQYLRDGLVDGDAQLLRRLAEPRVQAAIKSGMFGRQPVYLISAVKIAHGLSVQRTTARKLGGKLSGGLPVTESVSVGASLKAEKRDELVSSFTTDEDVVFAYQVHVLKVKGKKQEDVTVDVFESDAAFLHGEDGTTDAMEVSVELSGMGDLRQLVDDGIGLDKYETVDTDGLACTCISYSRS
jgi:hypothetical protein